MGSERENDIRRRLSLRVQEDVKLWEASIRQARDEGRKEGREEMKKLFESQQKSEMWSTEKQELMKRITELEMLRQADHQRMEAQVKEKEETVKKLEGELTQKNKKVEEMFAQFRNWMETGEGPQEQVNLLPGTLEMGRVVCPAAVGSRPQVQEEDEGIPSKRAKLE